MAWTILNFHNIGAPFRKYRENAIVGSEKNYYTG